MVEIKKSDNLRTKSYSGYNARSCDPVIAGGCSNNEE